MASSYSFRIIHKSGDIKWVELNSVETDWQGSTATLNFLRDITERKQAESELRESEEKFRNFTEQSFVGFYIIQDGLFKYVNPKFADIFSYTVAECLNNMHFRQLVHSEDLATVEDQVRRRVSGETPAVQYSFRGIRKSGEIINVEIYGSSLLFKGRPAVIGTMLDMTKSIELEKRIKHAEKMEAVGTLAGGVSHDFNNLLQAIDGYTQLLLLDKNEDDPERQSLQAIENACDRAAQLIRQLLQFSRKGATDRKPLNINQEVEQTRRILERSIPKMIDIEINTDGRLWMVNADPVQIEQIFLNLGSNAADAMPDGGKLVIETDNVILEDKFAIGHSRAKPGKYVLMTISDTGCGMDKETIKHIFEPFYTTKEIGKGTGLGLASVYGIVKSHDGYITCYSEPGLGTTFKIYLPAMEQMDSSNESIHEEAAPQGGVETILLVDDEDSVRNLGLSILGRYGYSVLTASSGEEALNLYIQDQNEIDLVILDIGMPGMGGSKCLREIKRLNTAAKVVIATGYSSNSLVNDALEAGAAGYIGKPYRFSDLLNKVRSALDEDC